MELAGSPKASPIAGETADGALDAPLTAVIVVVVLGAVTTVLDATIVSVALETLTRTFQVGLPTAQWVMTGYMLALTAVIPATGWAVGRFGGKQVWLCALGCFLAGSILCGLAWSGESLIAFRVLQGLGGGMVAPVGMTMVAQAAGPARMGRAMSMVGIPMMLGPVLGPVVGGLLVDGAGWRWIFFINVPIVVVTIVLSQWVLTGTPGDGTLKLDILGVLLLSPGLGATVYGGSLVFVDASSARGGGAAGWIIGGLVLLACFLWHALRTEQPLLELRHLRHRTFAAATTVQFLSGGVLLGSMLLLPLYFQVARGSSPLTTGLLMAPQGIGAAISLSLVGRLVDRGHGRGVVLSGVALLGVGLLAYTQATPATSITWLVAALLVFGFGIGALVSPVMAAAYSVTDRRSVPGATALLNVTQRVGGVAGTTLYALVLQHQLSHQGSGSGGSAASRTAAAFADTFWVPLIVTVAIAVPALLLPGRRPDAPSTTGTELPNNKIRLEQRLSKGQDMTQDHDELETLLSRWTAAELTGDTGQIDRLLDEDFVGIGPVGFVLDKKQWTNRYTGDLTNSEFRLTNPRVRIHHDTALVDGVQEQRTTVMGRDTSGSFRLGLVAVRGAGVWKIAYIQLSGPLVAPGAPPPFPVVPRDQGTEGGGSSADDKQGAKS